MPCPDGGDFGVRSQPWAQAVDSVSWSLGPGSLSDLVDRSEHGGRASTEVHDIEAHSGAMQRDIGGERSEGVMGRSPASAVD